MGRAFEYRRASKEARWGKMSKLFPKLGRSITMAAKEGGADPELNAKLRTAIMNAKAQNMPKDNIEAAIKRASGSDASAMVETTFEGKGPHGVLVYIDAATDNNTRTVANVKSYFNKVNGQLLTNGALDFMFTRKAVVEFEIPSDKEMDEIELELIDFGLEELEVPEAIEQEADEEITPTAIAYGSFADFGTLTKGIEDAGLTLKKANLQRIANDPKEFSDEQIEEIEKLLDKLDEDEDVQEVFTNIL